MTAPLKCPLCDCTARFREMYGPGEETWLECNVCGGKTDDLELQLANTEPETAWVQ